MNIEKAEPLVERLKNDFGVVLPLGDGDYVITNSNLGDYYLHEGGAMPPSEVPTGFVINLGSLEHWMELIHKRTNFLIHVRKEDDLWYSEVDESTALAQTPIEALLTAFIKYLEVNK